MTADQIHQYLSELNEGLRKAGQRGEIGIVGGAVMCLVYNARQATKYVDAIFEPSALIHKIAKAIALQHGLADDWLNDGAKAYLQPSLVKVTFANFSNLLIWVPEPSYMLAMKCISARWDSSDAGDVRFLIKYLHLSNAVAVFRIIEGYYPKTQIPAKTQFFIEEIFE